MIFWLLVAIIIMLTVPKGLIISGLFAVGTVLVVTAGYLVFAGVLFWLLDQIDKFFNSED